MEPLVGFAPTNSGFQNRSCSCRGTGAKWRPRQEFHLRPPPSHGGALIYLSYADKMASVAGLAPARTSLKGWLRELLCIHGRKWVTPKDVSTGSPAHRQALTRCISVVHPPKPDGFKMVPGVGIAPTSPPLQGGANLISATRGNGRPAW